MEDIWQQFHRLPKVIRDAVASPEALTAINRIEAAHPGLDLAGFVMRVMVRELSVEHLPAELMKAGNLDESAAKDVVEDLTVTVFRTVSEYLGLAPVKPASATAVTPKATPPITTPVTENPPTMTPRVAPAPPNVPLASPSPVQAAPSSPLAQPNVPIGNISPAPTLSTEDDAEIAAHSEKLRAMTSAVGPADFDTIAQSILDQHHLAFQDDLLTKRAVAVIKARLKGIRSNDDTKAMLMRPPKVGGLGLDGDIVTAVMRTIEDQASHAHAQGMTARPAAPVPPPPPRVPAPQTQVPAAIPPLTRDFSTMKPDQPSASVTEQPRASRPIIRPVDIPPPPAMPTAAPATPAKPKAVPIPVAVPTPAPAVQRARGSDRPSVSDITLPTTTLGPAEEMQSFTLAQFRRLGQGAAESAKKILDKLKHLEEESFSLWAEAVAGWRQSEVYSLYLDMGRQCLDQNISIDQVIQRRASAGQLYLSEHEFNVLADMNRQLQL